MKRLLAALAVVAMITHAGSRAVADDIDIEIVSKTRLVLDAARATVRDGIVSLTVRVLPKTSDDERLLIAHLRLAYVDDAGNVLHQEPEPLSVWPGAAIAWTAVQRGAWITLDA